MELDIQVKLPATRNDACGIFANLGLEGDFCDPISDRFE